MEYCFNITNPNKIKYDDTELKKFVTNLYMGTDEPKFKKDEKLPFFVITGDNNTICIKMTGVAKKNIARIEEINNRLTLANLKWKNNISLSKPLSDVGSNVMLRQEAKRQNVKPAELEVMLGNMEEITSVFCYPAWAMVYAYCLRSNDVRRWYGALAFITSVQYVLGTYANSS